MPSLIGDIRLEIYNHAATKTTFSYVASAVSAAFLTAYRGLPLCEVEVEQGGKIIKVEFSKRNESLSLNLPKCKQLSSKYTKFPSGIELKVENLFHKEHNKSVIVTQTDDVDLFEKSHLSYLLAANPEADISAAFSEGEGNINLLCQSLAPHPDATLLSALSAFASRESSSEITVSQSSEHLLLAPSPLGVRLRAKLPRLMPFTTPYL